MDPGIRHVGEPLVTLGLEIGVAEKLAAIEEIAAEIPDRAFDFALGLRPVGPAGPNPKAPVRREAEKLGIREQGAAQGGLDQAVCRPALEM